jgi:membrane protein required for colicin V production
MEDLGLTWFDFAAIIVLGLSGVMAFARGLIREAFSIVAFIGAFLAGFYLSPMFQPWIEGATPFSGGPARLAAGAVVFLVVYIAVTVITSALAKTVHQSTEIGSFDRAAGLAFGILRGVLIVALFVLFLRNTTENADNPRDTMPENIVSARTYPMFESVAVALERVLPTARQRAQDIIDNRGKTESAPIPPADAPATTDAGAEPAPGSGPAN